MRVFKDSSGREWTIALNIGAIKRVRDLMKLNGETVDLLSPFSGDPPLSTRLFLDLCLLVDVLYCICRPQCQERNVSDEDFGAAIAGEESKAAYEAFFEELLGFFQKAGREEAARMVTGNLKLIRAGMAETIRAVDRLETVGPGIIADAAEKAVDRAIADAQNLIPDGNGATSTNSLHLLEESIPTP